MRLDKFLKVSRLIKRRTVANEACDAGRVLVNGNVAKASLQVKPGDIIEIQFGTKTVKAEVLQLQDKRAVPVSVKRNSRRKRQGSSTGIHILIQPLIYIVKSSIEKQS